MQQQMRTKLEAARKELLDLGLRNPLLNYRLLSGRGLHIVQEKAGQVYEILVKQGKAMSFLPKPGSSEENGNGERTIAWPEISPEEQEETYRDAKLQTEETAGSLQTRLLNTYYAARTSLEEQGVNILYLALGLLHWYETPDSNDCRKAPLVLVPVSLERSSAREKFRLRYTGGEVETNLSLQAKLKTAFNIVLPGWPETEEEALLPYIQAVSAAVKGEAKWTVEPDAIELGFFSFGKFMIYHDLDSDEWPDENKPAAHPVLQSLFGNGFTDPPPSAGEELFIDTATQADSLYQVLDADSSQLLAMLAVQEGRNLVIQGPPGTGKSQTIANLIANAIGQGKKVLFVAEKQAALEVVKRRLDHIHLGDACLELHSHKANKKELHQELRRTLELGKPALLQLHDEVAMLQTYRQELNAYCTAVNTPAGQTGITPQQATGFLLQLQQQWKETKLPRLVPAEMKAWNREQYKRAEAFAERVEARLGETGVPAKMLFRGVGLQVLLPHAQEALQQQLQDTLQKNEQLQQCVAEAAVHTGLPLPVNRQQAIDLAAMLQVLGSQPDLSGMDVLHTYWLQQEAVISELLEAGRRLNELEKQYHNLLLPEAWELDILPVRQQLLAYGNKWYRFFIGSYRLANRTLAAVCKTGLPAGTTERLQYADAILEVKRWRALLQTHTTVAAAIWGNRWRQAASDWPALTQAFHYLNEIHRQVQQGKYPQAILVYLSKQEGAAVPKQYQEKTVKALQQHGAAVEKLVAQLALKQDQCFADMVPLMHRAFAGQENIYQAWLQRLPEIHLAIQWNTLAVQAAEQGLSGLTDAAAGWPEAQTQLKAALQKTWYEYVLEMAMEAQPVLRQFEKNSHETALQQFRRLDQLMLQYNRVRVALQHWENMPRLEAGGQVNVLRTEFNKKARHMPIRKLMREAGLAIQAIKPVFMMSPLSIANFLPPGAIEFDLVIFDEASQVQPVDALGAILRGKQLVVVGDAKQLPPTSFFDSLTREPGEEEDSATADMPSILGLCDAQGAPQRMLRWHYRSRHESLISLSNQEFYDNRLVIFPSAGSKDRLGLVFHHLAGTVYDRGKTRTNIKEAEAVADAVVEHARRHPRLSLGVVAFSTAQMQAIQNALEIRRRQLPDIEPFFRNHTAEPFFVKNLENVQGDERDVIFISIGYGRTADGSLSMSFGPLNNEGGEKRLNVLVTRAKLRCEIFTNITSEDIDEKRSSKYGIRALKNFLHFAQHGKPAEPGTAGKELTASPFETHIASLLASRGYVVHRAVGNAGCAVDLAIADRNHPGRYVLGIECDGQVYASARSARDRDRLRPQVLGWMGWNLYRTWSTDWLRNPGRELERLLQAIELAEQQAAHEAEEEEENEQKAAAHAEAPVLHRIEQDEPQAGVPLYQLAELPATLAAAEFHQHPLAHLGGWLEEIVRVESPVHIEEASRRLLEAADVTRMGPRIRESIQRALQYAVEKNSIVQKDAFLWRKDMEVPVLRNRSNLPPASRRLQLIAPEELSLAVVKVVSDAVAIQPEPAVPFVARVLGFGRVTEEMRSSILDIIETCVANGLVIKEAEWLRVMEQ
jgi:hypothetical protein